MAGTKSTGVAERKITKPKVKKGTRQKCYDKNLPWPWALRCTTPEAHVSLALTGHYTLKQFYQKRVTDMITDFLRVDSASGKSNLLIALEKTDKHNNENKFAKNVNKYVSALMEVHQECVRYEAATDEKPTLQHLLKTEYNHWKKLRTALLKLDKLGFAMGVLRKRDNTEGEIATVFNKGLIRLLGDDVTIRDFRSVFDSRPKYEAKYSKGKRDMFEKMRKHGLVNCKKKLPHDPIGIDGRPLLVNGKCWEDRVAKPFCDKQNGLNCDGGPGPGSDDCP